MALKKLILRFALFIFASLLLHSCSGQNPAPERRIIVIGLDALDLKILGEVIEQGRAPTFDYLMENGAYGSLQSYHPLLSPLIWTTIATGRPPDEHGINRFLGGDLDGNPIAVPSSDRKCAALWNIASEQNISCTVLGWYATWPAETIQGTIVSDRFDDSSQLDSIEDLPPEVIYPPDIVETLFNFRKSYNDIGQSQLSRFMRLNPEEWKTVLSEPFQIENRIHHFHEILARTETRREILLHLLKEKSSHLTLAYFDFTDSALHLFIEERPPKRPHVSQRDFDRFSGTVDAVYEYADGLIKDVLETLDDSDTLIVISDHGFKSGSERLERSSRTTAGAAAQWHRLEGTIIAYGNGVVPGPIKDASVFDLTPTLLTLLDIPPSYKMSGKALPELIGGSDNTTEGKRVDDLDGGYTPPSLPKTDSVHSPQLERLQALGYIGKESPDNESQLIRKYEADGHFNLAAYFEDQGQMDRAFVEIDRALALDPKHVNARGRKCALLIERGNYTEAQALIAELKTELEQEIDTFKSQIEAKRGERSDEEERAEHDRLMTLCFSLAELYHSEGEIYFNQRNLTAATQSFAYSIELDPDSMETLYNLGTCYGMTGHYPEAEECLVKVLERESHHRKGRQSLAVTRIRMKKGKEARPLLESLLEESPNDPNLLYLMGESYLAAQSYPEAIMWYKKALAIDPNLQKAARRLESLSKINNN